jgi:transcriptional regulator with XRE-family HTH domain
MKNLTSQLLGKIRSMRELKGITHQQMAEYLSLSPADYAQIEKEERELSLSALETIANKLDSSVYQLLGTNAQSIFQNFGDQNSRFSQNYYEGSSDRLSPLERELFEKLITAQQSEIDSLKSIIEKLMKS